MAKYKIEMEMEFNENYSTPTRCRECPFYVMDYDTGEFYCEFLYVDFEGDEEDEEDEEDDNFKNYCPIISIEKIEKE